MDEKALRGLKDAIAIWERIERGEVDEGDEKCPLCEEFCKYIEDQGYTCTNCPIYEKTGMENCDMTPYWKYSNESDDREKLAHDEVVFLRSLLPKGEGDAES